MAKVVPRRMTVDIEGDFVVFLIGLRINKPWKLRSWLPAFLAMPRMLAEISSHPEIGCLGYTQVGLTTLLQHWRSFERLEAYARSHEHNHWPAWVAFNKRVSQSRGDVGIWHETYQVAAGAYEAIYSGMPPYGLGKAGALVPASGRRESARGRITPSIEAVAE